MITNPFDWVSVAGAATFYGVLAAILSGCALKLFTDRWSDWLDERAGRGSIDDPWLLTRFENDARSARR